MPFLLQLLVFCCCFFSVRFVWHRVHRGFYATDTQRNVPNLIWYARWTNKRTIQMQPLFFLPSENSSRQTLTSIAVQIWTWAKQKVALKSLAHCVNHHTNTQIPHHRSADKKWRKKERETIYKLTSDFIFLRHCYRSDSNRPEASMTSKTMHPYPAKE